MRTINSSGYGAVKIKKKQKKEKNILTSRRMPKNVRITTQEMKRTRKLYLFFCSVRNGTGLSLVMDATSNATNTWVDSR